jgi:hypothetical protein
MVIDDALEGIKVAFEFDEASNDVSILVSLHQ